MKKDCFSVCIVMQGKKRVRAGQVVLVMKKLMQKLLRNGSIFHHNHRIDYLKYDNCYSNINVSTE